jgi:2-polyprenyl-3-methyl-5-hydroxy-6-metoxy-1,4-benzoquinol methylase
MNQRHENRTIADFPDPHMQIEKRMLIDQSTFDVEPIGAIYSFGSEACRVDHFLSPRYRYWCDQLKGFGPQFHRKQWEWVYIAAALHERGMLRPDAKGLGFGVGQEPLADLFASMGVNVLATDQSSEAAAKGGWLQSNQHVKELEQLHCNKISTPAEFEKRMSFRFMDMNDIDRKLRDFDFCWSACAFEHLGSIEHGLRFIHNSLDPLRKGGVSIHTTELNLSSDTATFESPHLSLFRKQDFKRLAAELRAAGHDVAPLVFYPGSHAVDRYVDLPPYLHDPHIRLELEGYVTTSFGIIVTKGG